MSRMSLKVSVGAFLVLAMCVPASSVLAQTPAHVRVIKSPAPIQRWLHGPATDVLRQVEPGTTLEVLDEDVGWFWVVAPPDAHGTRKPGWIRATNVEPVIAPALTATPSERDERGLQASGSPEANAFATLPPIDADKVTITERRDDTATPANAKDAIKAYSFEDVHFDRDRSLIRTEDLDTLRAAATALKADPSLVVNIAGYTCNLGTSSHNRELGVRRANAVKAYLVSEGIAADRLHTLSLGERDARHDNSREETRRLNRRVAFVVDDQR